MVQRLAGEMAGAEVVFLAHAWTQDGARELRVWAAHPGDAYFPIILVSSGYRVFTGPTAPYSTYRSMIEADLPRAPTGELAAWWRKDGSDVVVWATLRNTGAVTLSGGSNAAGLSVMVYEPIYEFPFQDPVRGTVTVALTSPVAPGATAHLQARVPAPAVADWANARVVALVDYRPGSTKGAYDAVQAARAVPARLDAAPAEVAVFVVPGATAPVERAVSLSGPSVLTWTATTDAPWLEVVPAAGTLPAAPVVRVHPDQLPSASASATVTVAATGEGMSFTQTVPVRVSTARLLRRHLVRR